jgi:hypothetical protein
MVDYITIQDRNLLHNATKELLSLLVERVCNERENVNLTPMLLKRVWRAAMACPGFTPSMKDDIVFICNIDINMAVELGLAPHAAEWRYLWTIGPKPGVPTDVLLVSHVLPGPFSGESRSSEIYFGTRRETDLI